MLKTVCLLVSLSVLLTFVQTKNTIVKTVMKGGEVWFEVPSDNICQHTEIEKKLVLGEKYVYEGGYFKIRDITIGDHGTYNCFHQPLESLKSDLFEVVVVDSVDIRMEPSVGLVAGNRVEITCLSEFYVSMSYKFNEEEKLHFSLDVGLEEADETSFMGPIIEIFNQNKQNLESKYNLTVMEEMDMKNITCRLHSKEPAFTHSASMWLKLSYAPMKIAFPEKNVFSVGEIVNCTAHSEPQPLVQWQSMHLPDDCMETDSKVVSKLTFSSLELRCNGHQTWKCVVRYDPSGISVEENNWSNENWVNNNNNNNFNNNNNNVVNDNNNLNDDGSQVSGLTNNLKRTEMIEVFNFTVEVDSTNKESLGSKSESSLIFGLVFGLGIPLLLIIIFLITCCVCRKNRSKKGTKTTLAKVIDPKKKQVPGPIKTVSGSRTVSVNAAPNPTSRSPPNVIRGSPGIPDIGAGHLGGSGSIPQLNDSMDGRQPQQYSNYSEMVPQQRQAPKDSLNFGTADLGANKGFTDI